MALRLDDLDLELTKLFLPRLIPPDTLCGFVKGQHSSGKEVWRAFAFEADVFWVSVLEYREPWENLTETDWEVRRRVQDAGCSTLYRE